MRLLYAVQRYGAEVAGGAESACRMFAERLAGRGHDVEVVTSCAVSYVDWADHYPPGAETIDGVVVHRLPVAARRDTARFDALSRRVAGIHPQPMHLYRAWTQAQGPTLAGYRDWLRQHRTRFDLVAFYTYLYETTTDGLAVAAMGAPTLVHPAAHDEWTLAIPTYDLVLRGADGLFFHTPEERQLVHRRFGPLGAVEATIGLGLDDAPRSVDEAGFRRRFGLGDRPYLVVLGRVDPNKGTHEAVEYFVAYKERNPGPLALVVMGERVHDLIAHPDIVTTGFVSEDVKHACLHGADVLVQPSYLESFSIALLEGFQHATPALVQRACDVLDGQVRRACAGLAYSGFAEFEAALQELAGSPRLRQAAGEAGRTYVQANYRWPVVLDRYEELLARTIEAGRRRLEARAA